MPHETTPFRPRRLSAALVMVAMLAVSTLVACASRSGRLGAEAAPVTYRFELQAAFESSVVSPEGRQTELPQLPDSSMALRGRIQRTKSRDFRDGSAGHLVQWLDVEQALTPDGPWERSELSGRSVEMRTFQDGEILDIQELEHLSHRPRYGDVYDFMFFLISPVVPRVDEGQEPVWRRASWPYLIEKGRGARTTLKATWTNLGFSDGPSGRSVKVAYEGELEGKGSDSAWGSQIALAGQATGTIDLRLPQARVVSHRFDWARTVTADFEGSGLQVQQQQQIQGSLTLEGGTP